MSDGGKLKPEPAASASPCEKDEFRRHPWRAGHDRTGGVDAGNGIER